VSAFREFILPVSDSGDSFRDAQAREVDTASP